MTSCRSTSRWDRLATSSRLTECCQFWELGQDWEFCCQDWEFCCQDWELLPQDWELLLQLWDSGSGSRSGMGPCSSSRRCGRKGSAPKPRLGESTLLGNGEKWEKWGEKGEKKGKKLRGSKRKTGGKLWENKEKIGGKLGGK